MKVYVDANDIGKTVTYKEENGKRQYLYVHDKEGFIFKDLSDYTKQVRKKVCEIIWGGFIGLNNINGNYEYKKFEDDFRKFLDQIQGETK